ncbi:hypothetical protein Rhopal_001283-T1 [Rhodotorula paludigena]|uniref:Cyclin N-terminal domain-containing protein n=1 Tax=Rhodotorula paludigena TaxID=86838 RepID=A0AAV5GDW7_9BASI|nr:hypothetical protein Rhopal_001283-T1 [Rhodotorula paludigena]
MTATIQLATSSTEAQWYYTKQELARAPSVGEDADGTQLARERRQRQEAVRMLWRLRNYCETTTVPVSAAATFVHRFYMRESFQQWDARILATAAFFLASKSEEEPRGIKNIVAGFLFIRNRHVKFDSQSPEFRDARMQILAAEEALLRVLCFDLTLRHPHVFLIRVCEQAWTGEEAETGTTVARAAWLFLHDSLAAPLCLLYTPPVLAAASLVLACAQLDTPLPAAPLPLSEQRALHDFKVQEAEEGEEMPVFAPKVGWLDLLGVKAEDVEAAARDMLDGYKLALDPFVVEESQKHLAVKVDAVLSKLTAAESAEPPAVSGDAMKLD